MQSIVYDIVHCPLLFSFNMIIIPYYHKHAKMSTFHLVNGNAIFFILFHFILNIALCVVKRQ